MKKILKIIFIVICAITIVGIGEYLKNKLGFTGEVLYLTGILLFAIEQLILRTL